MFVGATQGLKGVKRFVAIVGTMSVALGSSGLVANPVQAASENEKTPLAISIGDSFISGEGGQYAGNIYDARKSDGAQDKGPHNMGAKTYRDAWGGRKFNFNNWEFALTRAVDYNQMCHRSDSAEIQATKNAYGWTPVNLACSGAVTKDVLSRNYRKEDPQIKQLAALAKDPKYDIKTIVVSIGGNDVGFSDLMSDLVQISATNSPTDQKLKNKLNPFVKKKTIWESYAEGIPEVKKQITKTLNAISDTMRKAGYEDGSYRFVYQSYSNLFASSVNRYMAVDSKGQLGRTESPGVPLSNKSVDYSRSVMVPALTNMTYDAMKAADNKNIQFMNLTNVLKGHELSSKDTEQVLTKDKKAPSAATAEWVVPINSNFILGALNKTSRHQESFHPNRFGQEAYGACLVAAVKSDNRELKCVGQAGKLPNELEISYGGGKIPAVQGVNTQSTNASAKDAAIPAAPQIVNLEGADEALEITMKAPSSDGGAAITDFEYSTDGGNTWAGVDRSCICILLRKLAEAHATKSFNVPVEATWRITHASSKGTPELVPGEVYQVQVRAVNRVGSSKASNIMSAKASAARESMTADQRTDVIPNMR